MKNPMWYSERTFVKELLREFANLCIYVENSKSICKSANLCIHAFVKLPSYKYLLHFVEVKKWKSRIKATSESKFTKIIWHVRHEIYFHKHKTIYFTQCPLSISPGGLKNFFNVCKKGGTCSFWIFYVGEWVKMWEWNFSGGTENFLKVIFNCWSNISHKIKKYKL